MTDLLSKFAQAVADNPDKVAIVNGTGVSVTFDELQKRSQGLAAAWTAQGIKRGDRILIAMGISADLYASLAALWSIGATVVLPEPAMGIAGLRHAVKTTGVKAFCAAGPYRWLKVLVPDLWSVKLLTMAETQVQGAFEPPHRDAIALISFTSGTTGAPKAIPRSHGFLLAQNDAVAPLLSSETDERDLVAFPVFALINLAAGRTSVLPNWKMSRLGNVTPDALGGWIDDQKVTRALLPPALVETLGRAKTPTTLAHIFTGGGPVFPDTITHHAKEHPTIGITCVYGSTEAEPIAHLPADQITNADFEKMCSGAGLLVGYPTETTQVQVIDHEIQVAGGHVNRGYLDPAHDAENKVRDGDTVWHRTGDAGEFDDDGRLWLLGRIGSDVMIDGAPVFPFAVEVAARNWDGVTACALVAKNNQPILAVSGDKSQFHQWDTNAKALGIHRVVHLPKIPMDKRHASKVDRTALMAQMKA